MKSLGKTISEMRLPGFGLRHITIVYKTAENTKEHFWKFESVNQPAAFKIECKQWKDILRRAAACKPDADAFIQWNGNGCRTCGKTDGEVFENRRRVRI